MKKNGIKVFIGMGKKVHWTLVKRLNGYAVCGAGGEMTEAPLRPLSCVKCLAIKARFERGE